VFPEELTTQHETQLRESLQAGELPLFLGRDGCALLGSPPFYRRLRWGLYWEKPTLKKSTSLRHLGAMLAPYLGLDSGGFWVEDFTPPYQASTLCLGDARDRVLGSGHAPGAEGGFDPDIPWALYVPSVGPGERVLRGQQAAVVQAWLALREVYHRELNALGLALETQQGTTSGVPTQLAWGGEQLCELFVSPTVMNDRFVYRLVEAPLYAEVTAEDLTNLCPHWTEAKLRLAQLSARLVLLALWEEWVCSLRRAGATFRSVRTSHLAVRLGQDLGVACR
jgi:hypothetical protein